MPEELLDKDWPKINRRRGELIKKNIAGDITTDESTELERLQAFADEHIQRVAPRPPVPTIEHLLGEDL